jgi:hypothetical protein
MAIAHMLIILVLIGWLAVAIVIAAICVMAARGDSVSIDSQQERSDECEIGRLPDSVAEEADTFAVSERPMLEKNPIELLLYDKRSLQGGALTSRGVR